MSETTEVQATTETTSQTVESVPSAAPPTGALNMVQGFAKFMDDGGVFMWIILAMWVLGVIISVERVKKIFGFDVDGTSLMSEETV